MPTYVPPPSPPGSYAPPVSTDGQWLYSGGQWWPNSTVSVANTAGTGTTNTNTGTGTGAATTGAAATGIDPSQSTLSANFGPYVQDMLSKGWGAANLPYQEFTGQRFAGTAPLQQQAFTGYQNLQMPQQFGIASNMMADAGMRAAGMGYMPSTFGNFFQGIGAYQPGAFNAGFGYQAGPATQFGNQFQAPQGYRPSTDFTAGIGQGQYQGAQFTPGFSYQPRQITTGLGPVGSVQDYMSPYQSAVSDIEAREATRQADIARQGRGARFAQAGAFGGARQAIEEAEAQRNLATQIGDIRARGLQGAYDRALQQRAQEAQLGMTAQEATERARQFGAERGAQFGMEAQKAGELSRQFGAQFGQQGLGQLLEARRAQEQSQQFAAQQGMTAAQLQAQYGLSSQQAQEAARQFNAGQTLSAAQLQAQFGMDAQKATELSRQFAAQQALQQAQEFARYGLAGAQQTEASRQFGAQYGLDALRQQLAAAQGLGALAPQIASTERQNLADVLRAGEVQRGIAQQPLDFGYQQFQESMKYPYQQATFMQSLLQGLPLEAPKYETGASDVARIISGGLLGGGLYDLLFGKKD